jgi:hypothetical protein
MEEATDDGRSPGDRSATGNRSSSEKYFTPPGQRTDDVVDFSDLSVTDSFVEATVAERKVDGVGTDADADVGQALAGDVDSETASDSGLDQDLDSDPETDDGPETDGDTETGGDPETDENRG